MYVEVHKPDELRVPANKTAEQYLEELKQHDLDKWLKLCKDGVFSVFPSRYDAMHAKEL